MIVTRGSRGLAVGSKTLPGRSVGLRRKLPLLLTTALVGVTPVTTAVLFAVLAATPVLADGGAGSAGQVNGGAGGTDSATAAGGR